MLKRFFVLAVVSFAIALAVSMTASYIIQTGEANRDTEAKLNGILDDVGEFILNNSEEVEKIRKELEEVYLEKTRIFAEMIKINPGIIGDYDELCRIRDLMNVDELHVIDGDGILRAGSVPGYYGYDMASAAQSGEFMQIIENPNKEIVQDPQPNGAEGWLFQYAGSARKDAPGFVQIGMQPYRLEEALLKAAPENIFKQLTIDNSLRILLLSADIVVGDSKDSLINTSLSGISEGSGIIKLDEDAHYVAKRVGEYMVMAITTDRDMYRQRNSMLIVFLVTNALILFTLIATIGYWLLRIIIRPLGSVSHSLDIIANGDLGRKIDLRNTPEFALLSDSINLMVSSIAKMLHDSEKVTDALKDVIAGVENGAGSIDNSTRKLFDESQNLSVAASSQNDTVAEMSKIFDTIHTNATVNAEHAANASQVSRSVLVSANDGSNKMKEMMIAVKEIDSASQNISKVMKTIDDIAFQTNILALNAAVEAARAGVHGKGFAVVADEVRSLAAKSAEAAKQTEELINSSIVSSNAGVTIAEETAGKIDLIVDNIRKSAELMEEIVIASNSQAEAVGELNANIDNIRIAVSQTVLTAERIIGETELLQQSSTDMTELIRHLDSSASTMKLPQNYS